MIIDPELPAIKVAVHPRAKQLKLAVSTKGIRLTVPPFASRRQVMVFLENTKVWLKQTWLKQKTVQSDAVQPQSLPSQLHLNFGLKPVHIDYIDLDDSYFLEQPSSNRLYIHQDKAGLALTHYVIQQAKKILPQQLRQYAQRHHLAVRQIRIATPTTRWGSCSHDQNIMLHAGLMLMPRDYADYVMLHELAHIREMNHQAGFWRLLEHMYPAAKSKQREVKTFKLPVWWQSK
ncbi:M48 family metallopeptidase [Acinetobacter qingfengensis]|uniref:YgjP-like metallopeptidase domain-containing protein n=1 Tax=Acinetobacter qingfengensis TaxID=1262585 RepID=A0A1E7RE20_9GAMM|nr:YgjP-like metallopeptidase domain-containing protein [Acinetobacter qingfengensis]KAA8734403.1 M48 family metallopeptidase [Acinetobacter qingfengensis]OEY97588.1 hypothetical protein BJI46_08890 [Acinetobacter qingfengensis]